MEPIAVQQDGRLEPVEQRPPRLFGERFEGVVRQVQRVESQEGGAEVPVELVDGVVGQVQDAQSLERRQFAGRHGAQSVAAQIQLLDVGERGSVDAGAARQGRDGRVAQRDSTSSLPVRRSSRTRPTPRRAAPQSLAVVQNDLVVVSVGEEPGPTGHPVVGQDEPSQAESDEDVGVETERAGVVGDDEIAQTVGDVLHRRLPQSVQTASDHDQRQQPGGLERRVRHAVQPRIIDQLQPPDGQPTKRLVAQLHQRIVAEKQIFQLGDAAELVPGDATYAVLAQVEPSQLRNERERIGRQFFDAAADQRQFSELS